MLKLSCTASINRPVRGAWVTVPTTQVTLDVQYFGDNWIVAEEDDASQGGGRKKRARRNDSNAAANLTLDSDMNNMAPAGEEEEEEGWGEFNPDKDDEEEMHMFQPDADLETEDEENKGRESVASRVELVRGANDSVTSDRQLQVRCSFKSYVDYTAFMPVMAIH